MLDATRCSLAGLCLCLLAISAAAFPSSTVFCCAFLSLLLFGCPLFARLIIPSQAKPVAVKRHRRRVLLKTDTVANDSIGASVPEALASNSTKAFTFQADLWNAGVYGTSFMAVAAALLVAEIGAMAAMQAGDSNGMQAWDNNATLLHSGSQCFCLSGNASGLRSVCSAQLVLDHDGVDRSGCGGGARLGLGHGNRLSSGGGGQLGSEGDSRVVFSTCAQLRSGNRYRKLPRFTRKLPSVQLCFRT
jgi:hypothetical protein